MLAGGREGGKEDGCLPGAFSFLHQRSTLTADRLGPLAKLQARMQYAGGTDASPEDLGKADERLATLAETPGTFSAEEFHPRGLTVSLDYFR